MKTTHSLTLCDLKAPGCRHPTRPWGWLGGLQGKNWRSILTCVSASSDPEALLLLPLSLPVPLLGGTEGLATAGRHLLGKPFLNDQ